MISSSFSSKKEMENKRPSSIHYGEEKSLWMIRMGEFMDSISIVCVAHWAKRSA